MIGWGEVRLLAGAARAVATLVVMGGCGLSKSLTPLFAPVYPTHISVMLAQGALAVGGPAAALRTVVLTMAVLGAALLVLVRPGASPGTPASPSSLTPAAARR